jgi:hypothetical protein
MNWELMSRSSVVASELFLLRQVHSQTPSDSAVGREETEASVIYGTIRQKALQCNSNGNPRHVPFRADIAPCLIKERLGPNGRKHNLIQSDQGFIHKVSPRTTTNPFMPECWLSLEKPAMCAGEKRLIHLMPSCGCNADLDDTRQSS